MEDDRSYESNDGFSTSIWGSCLWHVLHIISFNYPVKPTALDKKHYQLFLRSLRYVLPCKVCRENFKKQKLSLKYFKSRHTLSKHLYNIHLSIPHEHDIPDYYTLRNNYEMFRSKCTPEGCLASNDFVKSKCVLQILPVEKTKTSFTIDKRCFKRLRVK